MKELKLIELLEKVEKETTIEITVGKNNCLYIGEAGKARVARGWRVSEIRQNRVDGTIMIRAWRERKEQ